MHLTIVKLHKRLRFTTQRGLHTHLFCVHLSLVNTLFQRYRVFYYILGFNKALQYTNKIYFYTNKKLNIR
jgi:hypothetical protein